MHDATGVICYTPCWDVYHITWGLMGIKFAKKAPLFTENHSEESMGLREWTT